MDVNNINNAASAYSLQTQFSKANAADGRYEPVKPGKPDEESKKIFDETAAVYERSNNDYPAGVTGFVTAEGEAAADEQLSAVFGKTDEVKAAEAEEEKEEKAEEVKEDRTELVKQLQAEAEARAQQIVDMVRETLGMQADHSKSIGELLGEVVEKTGGIESEEASEVNDSDDDYWGSEQTARRIVDFAIAISGGDTAYADQLLEAFKKGYADAESSLGGKLPQVCKNTYDKVSGYFDDWKNGTYTSSTEA